MARFLEPSPRLYQLQYPREYANIKDRCRLGRITIDMQWRQLAIDDPQCRRLEIKDLPNAGLAWVALDGISPQHLPQHRPQRAELVHLFYDDDIQQPIVQPGPRRNGEVIAELVRIGDADKKRFRDKGLHAGPRLDPELPAFARKEMPESDLDISL